MRILKGKKKQVAWFVLVLMAIPKISTMCLFTQPPIRSCHSNIPLDERVLVLLLARKSPFGELSVGQLDKLVSVAHGLSVGVGWQSSVLVFFGAVVGSGTVALIVNSRLYK